MSTLRVVKRSTLVHLFEAMRLWEIDQLGSLVKEDNLWHYTFTGEPVKPVANVKQEKTKESVSSEEQLNLDLPLSGKVEPAVTLDIQETPPTKKPPKPKGKPKTKAAVVKPVKPAKTNAPGKPPINTDKDQVISGYIPPDMR